MKNKTFLIGTCTIAILCAPVLGFAAEKKKSSATASPAANASASPTASASPAAVKAPRPIPFHGMVAAVDQKASTFTIAGKEKSRVFKVTDKSVVTKGSNAATLKDIAENQEVSGSYWKNADGSLEAKTVKVGPMGSAPKATDKSAAKTSASQATSPAASPKKP